MPTKFISDVKTVRSKLWKFGTYRMVQVTQPTQYSVYTYRY